MSIEPGRFGMSTRTVKAVDIEAVPGNPIAPPITPATTFHLGNPSDGLDFYGRASNPAWRQLESALAGLEGAASAATGNVFTWADNTIADERYVVKVPANIKKDVTAVIGCAVMTGSGAVYHTAGVKQGQSVAVFGVGGVGLSAIAAAKVVDAAIGCHFHLSALDPVDDPTPSVVVGHAIASDLLGVREQQKAMCFVTIELSRLRRICVERRKPRFIVRLSKQALDVRSCAQDDVGAQRAPRRSRGT